MTVLSIYGTKRFSNDQFAVDQKSGHGVIVVEVKVAIWVHSGFRCGTIVDLFVVVEGPPQPAFLDPRTDLVCQNHVVVSVRSGDMC